MSVIDSLCLATVQGKGPEGYREALELLRAGIESMSERADRLAALLGERELECLLVSDLVNVRWLTGFTGTNGACLITGDERLFFTDFRYVEQAKAQVDGFEQVEVGRDMLAGVAGRLAGRAGFDDATVTVRTHAKLAGKARRRAWSWWPPAAWSSACGR